MKQNGVLFQHGVLNGNQVMVDYLDDNLRRLRRVLEQIDEAGLHWKLDPGANSIAVTIWHMGRLMDVFFTLQVKGESSANECWVRNGWAERTGHDPRGTGSDGWGSVNGYSSDEVAAIPRFRKVQVLGYLEQVCDAVRVYIQRTPKEDLAQAAPGFGGRYTRYQVLSMVLMDQVRHLGEIYVLKAARERKGVSVDD